MNKKSKILYTLDHDTNLTRRSVGILCTDCNGTGEIEENGPKVCRSCHGIGFIEIQNNDDEIKDLRYQLFHITAERDELAIKLTRWEESYMAKEIEQQKNEIERLKAYIVILHKSISKI